MTVFLVILAGWILCSFLLLVSLHGLYLLGENAGRTRQEEEEGAVEELRAELEERGIALFEIPEGR